jgi:hypothetical protein
MTELQLWKLFHWQFVLIKIWYYQKQPSKTQPKSWSRCDEIILRDEITGLDGNNLSFIYQKIVRYALN